MIMVVVTNTSVRIIIITITMVTTESRGDEVEGEGLIMTGVGEGDEDVESLRSIMMTILEGVEVEVGGIVKMLHRIGDGEIGEMMVVLPIGLDMIKALKICSSFPFLLSTSSVFPFWSLFLSHLF